MKGVYAAVTRQTLDGEPAGGWFPEERVDRETAPRACTVSAARAAGEEDRKGRLAPGLLADIVVLDADPFTLPPSALEDVAVRYTIVDGRVVYERN
jgi:predicted amidohydrolase YtcJ